MASVLLSNDDSAQEILADLALRSQDARVRRKVVLALIALAADRDQPDETRDATTRLLSIVAKNSPDEDLRELAANAFMRL